VVPELTGHEHKELSPRYPAFGGRASPTSVASFLRIPVRNPVPSGATEMLRCRISLV